MGLDAVRPALSIPEVHRKQDANGQSGREPQHKDKPRQSGTEEQEQPDAFLNAFGEVTGKTINTAA
jgi:hypothetical protein